MLPSRRCFWPVDPESSPIGFLFPSPPKDLTYLAPSAVPRRDHRGPRSLEGVPELREITFSPPSTRYKAFVMFSGGRIMQRTKARTTPRQLLWPLVAVVLSVCLLLRHFVYATKAPSTPQTRPLLKQHIDYGTGAGGRKLS